jgi:hypothetical protein
MFWLLLWPLSVYKMNSFCPVGIYELHVHYQYITEIFSFIHYINKRTIVKYVSIWQLWAVGRCNHAYQHNHLGVPANWRRLWLNYGLSKFYLIVCAVLQCVSVSRFTSVLITKWRATYSASPSTDFALWSLAQCRPLQQALPHCEKCWMVSMSCEPSCQ